MAEIDINKRTVEALIKCGVFDSLGVKRSALIASYEGIIDSEYNKHRNNISGQLDIFSLAGSDDMGVSESYSYPDMPEYSLRELLMLEKESSGMYFSGHMIDNYSLHAENLKAERISDILEDAEEDNLSKERRFQDKETVKIIGIITSKKTKIIKNGDTMAFLKLEDRYGEIEVIVFAKQYKKFLDEIFVENAVCIEGAISFEDGDEVRILLSNLLPLKSNADFGKRTEGEVAVQSKKEEKIYVKVPSISDSRIPSLTRLALINPGASQIIVYDSTEKRYHSLKDVRISTSDKVVLRLKSIFGEDSVVLK